jgi:hypothetical protein
VTRLTWGWGIAAVAMLAASCGWGTSGTTTCEPVPNISWRLPDRQGRTPYPIEADPSAVNAAKILKDVVFTHARDPQNPWAVAHAMLAIGAQVELTNGRDAVEYVFEEYGETFEVCGETLLRFPRHRGNIRVEPHTDLLLKQFVELGVPPDKKVKVQGKEYTVGHLYRGSLHRAWVEPSSGPSEAPNAVLDRVPYGAPDDHGPGATPAAPIRVEPGSSTVHWNDTPWALQALTGWAPIGLGWTAEGGRKMTLERFTRAAVARLDLESQALQVQKSQGQDYDRQSAARAGGLVSMTCGGAHMLQGTSYALARGFGEPQDLALYERQVDLLFWRYPSEMSTIDKAIEQQPRYRTLLMMQRLKFLGHFLETTHKWAAMGILRPNAEQDTRMREAAAQLVATVAVLQQTGVFANLAKLKDPATPQIYADVGYSNEQLYLDYVGDSAHGYRGLDLALGHGAISY